MKTQLKLLVFAIAFISILFQTSKITAQYWGPLPGPARWELQTSAPLQYIFLNTGAGFLAPGAATLPGVGINFAFPKAPNYMLDIFSNLGVGDGVNVSDGGANSVGYSIGGTALGGPTMFLWHAGDPTSVFCGIQSGFPNSSVACAGSFNNTFVGYNADVAFAGANGSENVAVGSLALTKNTAGSAALGANTACGYLALTNNITAVKNTAMGWHALEGTALPLGITGNENTALGSQALQADASGASNTAVGQASMWRNTSGNVNTAVGVNSQWTACGDFNVAIGGDALFSNTVSFNTSTGTYSSYYVTTGQYNSAFGYYALRGANPSCTGNWNTAGGTYSLYNLSTGDSNADIGAYSLYSLATGHGNAALGVYAGGGVNTVNDYDNLFLGSYTNKALVAPPVTSNSAAIGFQAQFAASGQMELGNNNVTTTLGLSGFPPSGPLVTRLEINTDNGNAPFNVGPIISPSPVMGLPATGWSGVRLDDLTANSTPGANPGLGVLGLSAQGDIIYVTGVPSPATIGTCAIPTVIGPGGGGFDLFTNINTNFYFEGNGLGTGATNVLIGEPPCAAPKAKLDVLQASGSTSTIGISLENTDLGTCANPVIGIKSLVDNPANLQTKIAGWFEATPSANCTGGLPQTAIYVPQNGGTVVLGFPTFPLPSGAELYAYGEIYDAGNTIIYDQTGGTTALIANSTISTTGMNIGAQGVASGSSTWNFGVQGTANGTTGTINEGVWGYANSTSGNNFGVVGEVGCTSCGSYAGYFVGDIFCTGNGYAISGWTPSDSTIKRKINSFSNAMSIIEKLQPRTYYYDSINKYNFSLDTSMHYGFIAQELRRTVPCMVRTVATPPQWDTATHSIVVPASTVNAVDYNQFAAILTAGFQEQLQIAYNDSVKQKQTIDSLRAGLNSITASHDSLRTLVLSYITCLNILCPNSPHSMHSRDIDSTTNIQDVNLSNSNTCILYQNSPNPFQNGTKISYYLPDGTQGAVMLFFDNYGNKIKEAQLNQTGNGTLNINPENLTSGIYSYSLVVNGKVIDTKRMILQK